MDAQQQVWAKQFQALKRQQSTTDATSLESQSITVAEEIAFQKQQVLTTNRSHNPKELERRLNRLIELRAKLCVLRLLILQKKLRLTDALVEKETKMYYTECARIITAVEH